jgi:hypothetical protein
MRAPCDPVSVTIDEPLRLENEPPKLQSEFPFSRRALMAPEELPWLPGSLCVSNTNLHGSKTGIAA